MQVFGRGLSIDLGNNVRLELVQINSGTFQMGSEENDGEKPVHRVTISRPFYLGKYEVTQAQWRAMMGTTVAQQQNKEKLIFGLKGEGGNYPMYYVSWDEVQEFIVRLNALNNGLTYRLPTEAVGIYGAGRSDGAIRIWGYVVVDPSKFRWKSLVRSCGKRAKFARDRAGWQLSAKRLGLI